MATTAGSAAAAMVTRSSSSSSASSSSSSSSSSPSSGSMATSSATPVQLESAGAGTPAVTPPPAASSSSNSSSNSSGSAAPADEAEAEAEEEAVEYITRMAAMKQYKVRSYDLHNLVCTNYGNPKYPMRKYKLADVLALKAETDKKKQADWDWKHSTEFKQQQADKRHAQSRKDAVALQVPVFECPARPNAKQGLPTVLWVQICAHLADDLEADGLRSVSVVAREMVRFCSLSKELYEALPGALSRLGTLLPPTPANEPTYRGGWPHYRLPSTVDWAAILPDPMACKRPVLDKAASSIGVVKSGVLKVSLAKKICERFGVSHKSQAHPAVLWAVQREKNESAMRAPKVYAVRQQLQQCEPEHLTKVTFRSAFTFRKSFFEAYGNHAAFATQFAAWQVEEDKRLAQREKERRELVAERMGLGFFLGAGFGGDFGDGGVGGCTGIIMPCCGCCSNCCSCGEDASF